MPQAEEIRITSVECTSDGEADQVKIMLVSQGKPVGCAILQTKPGLGLEKKFENVIRLMLK